VIWDKKAQVGIMSLQIGKKLEVLAEQGTSLAFIYIFLSSC
jgi:hypothetical protein